ncbi:MAG: hypothetical protein V4543_03435 [Bacteroidota bacterium]
MKANLNIRKQFSALLPAIGLMLMVFIFGLALLPGKALSPVAAKDQQAIEPAILGAPMLVFSSLDALSKLYGANK